MLKIKFAQGETNIYRYFEISQMCLLSQCNLIIVFIFDFNS